MPITPFVKCKKGKRYYPRFADKYEFHHWENRDGSRPKDEDVSDYNAWDYFDDNFVYLGPDTEGIEPIFQSKA